MPNHHDIEKFRAIKSFPSLVKHLRDDLDWPLESDDVDPITFEYYAKEIGLPDEYQNIIKDIRQLRPLAGNQPRGIFFVNFEKKKLPVVVMRRLLRALVFRKRASANKSDRQAWHPKDLLFISAYGEESDRAITHAFRRTPRLRRPCELRIVVKPFVVIVTGLSGSGKSLALRSLEDSGFFCVDNLPASLIDSFVSTVMSNSFTQRVGIGMDFREKGFLHDFGSVIKTVRDKSTVEVIFLEAEQGILLRRFKETRRPHPLSSETISLEEALRSEISLLQSIKRDADRVIDTSSYTPHQLRSHISSLFISASSSALFPVNIISFGFKYGIPQDIDLLFDVSVPQLDLQRCGPRVQWQHYLNMSGSARVGVHDARPRLVHGELWHPADADTAVTHPSPLDYGPRLTPRPFSFLLRLHYGDCDCPAGGLR